VLIEANYFGHNSTVDGDTITLDELEQETRRAIAAALRER
jgi:hypothetical protein